MRGSSPRVRGTLRCRFQYVPAGRFIPACAGNTALPSLNISYAAVHPRVCGEHQFEYRDILAFYGSSPRVRGTHPRHSGRCSRSRFIPACAGNTIGRCRARAFSTVHPRVCGEHTEPSPPMTFVSGSSPRVRGTHCTGNPFAPATRFIPACAGNTEASQKIGMVVSVHPRVCGEHRRHQARSGRYRGSSPRVRGTQNGRVIAAGKERFIPACAGNTTLPC